MIRPDVFLERWYNIFLLNKFFVFVRSASFVQIFWCQTCARKYAKKCCVSVLCSYVRRWQGVICDWTGVLTISHPCFHFSKLLWLWHYNADGTQFIFGYLKADIATHVHIRFKLLWIKIKIWSKCELNVKFYRLISFFFYQYATRRTALKNTSNFWPESNYTLS